jgi:hypothetical protein
VKASDADDYLRLAVVAAVADGLPAVEVTDPQEVDRLESELTALAADYGNGLITRSQWVAARAGLDHRLNEAIARWSRSSAAVPANLETAWPTLTVSQRRSIVLTLVEKVKVAPAVPGRNTFDPERLSITWRA